MGGGGGGNAHKKRNNFLTKREPTSRDVLNIVYLSYCLDTCCQTRKSYNIFEVAYVGFNVSSGYNIQFSEYNGPSAWLYCIFISNFVFFTVNAVYKVK